MAVVCNNQNCKYRKAVFCGRDYTMLNQFGMCDIFFNKNGQMRSVPLYPLEPEPNAATEQELPHEELSESSVTSERNNENNEETENFLVREG